MSATQDAGVSRNAGARAPNIKLKHWRASQASSPQTPPPSTTLTRTRMNFIKLPIVLSVALSVLVPCIRTSARCRQTPFRAARSSGPCPAMDGPGVARLVRSLPDGTKRTDANRARRQHASMVPSKVVEGRGYEVPTANQLQCIRRDFLESAKNAFVFRTNAQAVLAEYLFTATADGSRGNSGPAR